MLIIVLCLDASYMSGIAGDFARRWLQLCSVREETRVSVVMRVEERCSLTTTARSDN